MELYAKRGDIELYVPKDEDPNDIKTQGVVFNPVTKGETSVGVQQALKWGYWEAVEQSVTKQQEVSVYVDIVQLDKIAKPVVLGSVSLVDGKVTFTGLSENMKASLQSIKVGDVTFTPADGVAFIEAMPKYLHGAYLWATAVKQAKTKVRLTSGGRL